mmetsp:Transcript_13379/g.22251  ORF Transcript_13379/g.22251 Transcript_13379/m.22251 type:complete len:140 (-) Transcript_13379:112-531(-)
MSMFMTAQDLRDIFASEPTTLVGGTGKKTIKTAKRQLQELMQSRGESALTIERNTLGMDWHIWIAKLPSATEIVGPVGIQRLVLVHNRGMGEKDKKNFSFYAMQAGTGKVVALSINGLAPVFSDTTANAFELALSKHRR